MCVVPFSTFFSETLVILRGNEREMIKKRVLVFM